MEKKLKRQRILNIILIIALVVGFVQLSEYKTEAENRYNNLSNQLNRVSQNIQEIYNNVDHQLEEDASLITYFNYEYGEADMENMKVPVSVKIIPKTVTDYTSLTLDFGNRTVEMKKGDKMEFTADFTSDLFLGESGGKVKVIIKEGNTSHSEELEWYIDSLHTQYLPQLMAGFIFDDSTYTEGEGLTVQGDVMFMGDIEEDMKNFTDLKLVYKINQKIVEEEEIPETAFDTAVDTIDVNKTYPDVRTGDTFTLYVEGTDKYGFVHRTTAKSIVYVKADEIAVETMEKDSELILDKEGNILYGEK